ncbi:energy-coupling factor transport system substrate-specific component [Bacillus sp. SLBN-46]|jgi:energy-coupling factor transport system substrate-specific component|uniref:ECF transporter S component n=1 Tax=Bacillus sp. SLBN-46 TaxID=3042283 RepID=UPI0028661A6F|nr:ECF transporter S component [Bacillus sp. SLBN-46]MDR6123839.1 energy-coupling factor transport system substrate-specific component [Bacillus sp. SLBN-46]
MRRNKGLTTILVLSTLGVVLGFTYFFEDAYLWLSFGFVFLAILIFLVRFERRKVEPRELVLLAVLASIAAVGRIPFASLPSVQPTTFVIMMSGFVFGAESGFIIGAVAALASNMILGQGPWTPWQMAAWGLVGLTAGGLRNTKIMNKKAGRIIFGIVWGFLFGWVMNLWGFLSIVQSGSPFEWKAFIVYLIGSATFDTMHAVSNVIFLLLFGEVWIKILTRFKRKYGLLE